MADFQNSFTVGFSSKTDIKSKPNFPPNIIRVATVRCKKFKYSSCVLYVVTVDDMCMCRLGRMTRTSSDVVSRLHPFCKPSPAHCTSLSSQHTWPAERFRSPIRRSGTRCLTSSEIRRVVLTVLSSFLRQSCLVFTNVTSALEVFKCYVLYKSSFYLLTYSYIPSSTLLITPMNQLNSLSLIFTQIFFNHLCLMPPFRAVWDDSLGIA